MIDMFFYLSNTVFFYIECEYLVMYSSFGILKIRKQSLIHLLVFKNSITSYVINYNITYFLNTVYGSIINGYTSRFKLIGVGYRQYYSNNIVMYKLRYNHLVYNVVPLNIITYKKHKKKKFFSLFSLDSNKLNNIVHLWMTYRVPNVYTKKGFFKKGKTVIFKKIVKKLL